MKKEDLNFTIYCVGIMAESLGRDARDVYRLMQKGNIINAKRFFREGRLAFLNVFELDDEIEDISRKTFEAYDGEWLDYVVECRRTQPHDTFDIV